ncbi:MAG: DNA sulfur modification protein DndD [Turicibacter sp.]|nr:DNA sulfur modification protein DndD [Turicibacter sp.]
MKVNYIVLENIGPYINRNQFDFETDESKNIILIGGKNGAGKTTLLNSIKIALFGCYALGLKTESTTYYNYLKKLFNDRELLKEDSKFGLEVEFDFIQDYEKATYKIIRTWESTDNFFEKVIILKNGSQLTDSEFEEFNEEFRSLFSPKLLDALLFDGEEVAKYFADNLINEYLQELFTNLLNLDLLDNLDSDLLQYLNKVQQNQQDSSDFILYKNKEQNLKRLEDEKKSIERHLDKLQNKINDNQLEISHIERTFKNHGGLTESGKTQYLLELSQLEKSREESNNEVKFFLENLYPFALNKQLLQQIKDQISLEKPIKFINQLNELTAFLDGNLDLEIKKIQHYLKDLQNGSNTPIHNCLEVENLDIDYILNQVSESNINKYQQTYQSYLSSLTQIQEIKKIIEKNESTKELASLLEKKDSLIEENQLLDHELLLSKNKLDELNSVLTKELNQFEQLKLSVENKNKETNSINIVENILKTKDRFKKYLLENKLKEIEELATNIFLQVNRKENYISSIQIDQDTFELKIMTPDGVFKNAEKFSAGERQLLFASILMAIIKLTELQSMMVFDTPLARLDKEHSYSFVNSIIKNAGKQVLILSTDDEIIGDLYQSLKSQISKEYTLDYDEKNNRTFIQAGYFID